MELTDRVTQLQLWIEQKEARINSGTIINDKTLKYAKRDIKRWKQELTNIEKQL